MDAARKTQLLETCIGCLLAERSSAATLDGIPADAGELWNLFRALVNTRPPLAPSSRFVQAQDELLRGMIEDAGVSTIADATPSAVDGRIFLWRGDITTLAVDAIVNAANSQMLGCWVPGHHCIDNAIHTFAGVQLRCECARVMEEQGFDEPTAHAKVTPAYNLPARWIVHTVGPIVSGQPTQEQCGELAQCYRSCLDAAAGIGAAQIAFCCISTGVFAFPQDHAASIALDAVRSWLSAHPGGNMHVIFNVFSETDEAVYARLLGV